MPESPAIRRKRLLFRSRQRGMLETSLLLRAFAEHHLDALDDDGLDRFETLLEANDADLLDWVIGKKAVPAAIDGDLVDLIKNFRKNI